MKAAFIQQTGPASSIQYGELPTPEITDSQVLVRVGAVSVNPIDLYIRSGAVAAELPSPYIIGSDLAGTVEAVGAKVTRFKVGDRVWGVQQSSGGHQGTFSQWCAMDPQWLHTTPEDVCDEDAAAIALVGITANLGMIREARLQPGETIFVHGGTGGVGSAVVQMGKAVGARVIATAGGEEKAERCRDLGADIVIDYRKGKVAEQLQQHAAEGVNVFFETLREPDFDFAIAAMAPRGRMVVMAGRDARPEFPVGPFYVKGCSLHGFMLLKASAEEQQAAADDINRWMAAKQLRPLIDRVMSLSEAAEAHALQEKQTLENQSNLVGKLVLTP
ncbi:alcohol dehydrogenase zinc-binding domain-containing protein [Rhodopirellula maiorica SM1]|uniref:Alcohol dehydrogenase zinc-binding domain-containing protein n=1 Tax=Rhodopirellula maiorica SM1 TaxID=1265738 RepID=M5RQH6_9BACT|nr:NADPH:quinone reductase [Rhodopirellula maiorica]EMI21461.1 alcohol dehydrogenase zinc-binding domain-containing protein [Rhodopirellula maiorica SM1]